MALAKLNEWVTWKAGERERPFVRSARAPSKRKLVRWVSVWWPSEFSGLPDAEGRSRSVGIEGEHKLELHDDQTKTLT